MKIVFSVGFAVICVLMSYTTAHACRCVSRTEFDGEPEKYVRFERERAFAVFAGKVTRIDEVKNARGAPSGVVKVTFAVLRAWKGASANRIVVSTTNVCCICGYPFEVGGEYLVYASGESVGDLRTSICTRTKKLNDAAEDLRFLGDGEITPRRTRRRH